MSLPTLIAASSPQQRTALRNLSRLYTYDLSERSPHLKKFVCDAEGNYDECVQPYLDASDCDCYLIDVDGEWAGFVIVRKITTETDGSTPICQIAEFFVLRKFRRRGIATQAAHAAFDRYSGIWEVHVLPENEQACAFWQLAIETYCTNGVSPSEDQTEEYECRNNTYNFASRKK